jgi:hypothetical protein
MRGRVEQQPARLRPHSLNRKRSRIPRGDHLVRRLASVASRPASPIGRKIIAQGKRSAALGNEAIMNIGVGGWLPRAAVAALLCPGLFSPCPSGAADGASWIGYDCPQPNSPKTLKRTGLSLLGLALGFLLCSRPSPVALDVILTALFLLTAPVAVTNGRSRRGHLCSIYLPPAN